MGLEIGKEEAACKVQPPKQNTKERENLEHNSREILNTTVHKRTGIPIKWRWRLPNFWFHFFLCVSGTRD